MDTKRIGAHVSGNNVEFRVWAPQAEKVEVLLPEAHLLSPEEKGYFSARIPGIKAGQLYKFRLNGKEELPDPASRFQPEGVHGPSQVVDEPFSWSDQSWKGVPLEELVIYELHVGTFTAEGTFLAVKNHLARLKDLGITAIEIMPVSQFPGKRNWGYDGVSPFAPQNSYGQKNAPEELKSLVNECHKHGIAVILDVVYNHMGPEGNYLPKWGPYFQDKYKTPWGEALNFDGEHSDEVRHYFLQNVRQWIEEYHFDGLRLDAIHAILDTSARPFLAEATDLAHDLAEKLDRHVWMIAESDGNDPRVLQSTREGGLGFDAQWADDLHHCIHSNLTKENEGYYSDYVGEEKILDVFKHGTYFRGQYSDFRKRRHGRPYSLKDRHRLVVCAQNHDQIGNRARGERLGSLVDEEKLKAAAALNLLSGGMPLIFMGEEIGESNPFAYFVDHTDKELRTAVREGRKKEFAAFTWKGEIPDPGAEETFNKSKPQWSELNSERGKKFTALYKSLINTSKELRRRKVWNHPDLEVKIVNSVLQAQLKNQFKLSISLQSPYTAEVSYE
ncbi:hypothetical protein AZI86_13335 [Bdellovibrio bacteriovorus]|uniref:Malto-oligosyltrehalose trehalohydrolase n=1 Tax=Bdellovibrio bacteriovorus TaxID=959 RepID=A0A150WJU5_BDEBC|nr:malto-oligosyltrehalose trehalohydrolase [Bdellovibrio bacteriovorus]KYG63801.1 hypothetical protein AZI86_13335 [Bdellovibrio bacteriovorus]